jgi:hypothetical protein
MEDNLLILLFVLGMEFVKRMDFVLVNQTLLVFNVNSQLVMERIHLKAMFVQVMEIAPTPMYVLANQDTMEINVNYFLTTLTTIFFILLVKIM